MQATTGETANKCLAACVGRWGEAECRAGAQQCGFPYNNATSEYAGTEKHVGCILGELGGGAGGATTANAGFRAAAQECARKS